MAALNDRLHWYKDAVIYELHIKAFRDGNGDGIGDFTGLLQSLDYLQDLGVTAIWLLPFYPSPLRDDGYDISDYYHIHRSYGDITQFRTFLEEAHRRNLKVITELVINHTSDQHPWFQRARHAPADSDERNFYVWSDDPTKYKDVRIIFQDFEPSNWSFDPVANAYYWHRFFHHQPDLNYDNPLVQEEIFRIIDYWCGMGVDGFRLDAIPYLFEREGTNGENLPETHAFLKKLRKHVDEHFPTTVLLAEANMWPEDAVSYFGMGDECQMNYHFPAMPRMFMALQMEDRYPITDIFDQTPAIPDTCQWALFLRNHDELTLEMVTDEERDYMYKVYAKDPKARINLGIRHRLAPLMENNRRKIELLNFLLFSLPGTPVIYYGDEIGMGDNVYLGDRDGVRTPMQWSPDRNGGFSNANPQKLYLPLILDFEYHYESVNVEAQRANTSSLYWFTKRLINMRKKFKAFGRGDMHFLNIENAKILAFTRCYEKETILVIVNLSKFSQAAEVDLASYKGYTLTEVVSRNKFPSVKEDGSYFFTLAPYAFHWFSLRKAEIAVPAKTDLPEVQLELWDEIVSPVMLQRFEGELLGNYLAGTSWFNGLNKNFYSVVIENHGNFHFEHGSVLWMQLGVTFQSGLPETYQLALNFVSENEVTGIRENNPHALVAQLTIGSDKGYLCDAFFTRSFQLELIRNMARQSSTPLKTGHIDFYSKEELTSHWAESDEIKSRIHASDEYNTSISYDNRFFLKLYRKIDKSINPDLEITRFLTNDAKFPYIPAFIGAIEWKVDDFGILLGIMQVLIENHGDGRSFFLERSNNYLERILASDREKLKEMKLIGTLADPAPFDQLPEAIKLLIGNQGAEFAGLLGKRTGQMHLALASGTAFPDFQPEDFTIYYQRSLYSTMQSLVRETFQMLSRTGAEVSEDFRQKANQVLTHRDDILSLLKNIFAKKLDILKIRVHGNFQLEEVLLTGKDLMIDDYGGEVAQSYSERRLKRSVFIDVSSMISSFYKVAQEGFEKNDHVPPERSGEIKPYYQWWAAYHSGFFLRGYLDTVVDTRLIPADKSDLRMTFTVYLLQEGLKELNHALTHHTGKGEAMLDLIISILGMYNRQPAPIFTSGSPVFQ